MIVNELKDLFPEPGYSRLLEVGAARLRALDEQCSEEELGAEDELPPEIEELIVIHHGLIGEMKRCRSEGNLESVAALMTGLVAATEIMVAATGRMTGLLVPHQN